MTKQGLTVTEHQLIGSELKAIRDRLSGLVVDISGRYPQSNNPGRLADQALTRIDRMRSELDSAFAIEHPAEFDVKVYYGGSG